MGRRRWTCDEFIFVEVETWLAGGCDPGCGFGEGDANAVGDAEGVEEGAEGSWGLVELSFGLVVVIGHCCGGSFGRFVQMKGLRFDCCLCCSIEIEGGETRQQ